MAPLQHMRPTQLHPESDSPERSSSSSSSCSSSCTSSGEDELPMAHLGVMGRLVAKRSLTWVAVVTVVAAALFVFATTGGAFVASARAAGIEAMGLSSEDSKEAANSQAESSKSSGTREEDEDEEAETETPTPEPTTPPTPVPSPKEDPVDFYKEQLKGEGLHTSEAEGLGTCGFGSFIPRGLKAVALNHGDLSGNKACGMCIMVIMAKDIGGRAVGAIEGKTFFVNNEVYGKHGDVAFDIDETKQRGVTLEWKAVPCPYSGKLEYQLLHPSGYYVAAKPMGMIYPVKKMELKVEGTWETGHLDGSGYLFSWNNDKGQFRFPLEVKLTSVNGEVIEDTIKHLSEKRQPGTGEQFTAPAEPPQLSCTDEGEDCRASKCCAVAGNKCYAKNPEWAICKADCVKGKDPADPKEFRTPWSCDILGGAPAGAPPAEEKPAPAESTGAKGCSKHDGDCRQTQCCVKEGDLCYEKNDEWAVCREECVPGKHDDDPKGFRTPWTCNILVGAIRK